MIMQYEYKFLFQYIFYIKNFFDHNIIMFISISTFLSIPLSIKGNSRNMITFFNQ